MTEVKDGLYGIEWPEGKENETLNVIFNDGSNKTDDLVAQINTCFNNSGYVKDMPVNEKPIDATITISLADASTEYIYNGKEHKAKVVVKADGTVLTENIDYTLSYTNNVNAGEAVVTITATVDGNYSGEVVKNFVIKPAEVTIEAIPASSAYNDEICDLSANYKILGNIAEEDILC